MYESTRNNLPPSLHKALAPWALHFITFPSQDHWTTFHTLSFQKPRSCQTCLSSSRRRCLLVPWGEILLLLRLRVRLLRGTRGRDRGRTILSGCPCSGSLLRNGDCKQKCERIGMEGRSGGIGVEGIGVEGDTSEYHLRFQAVSLAIHVRTWEVCCLAS